MDDIGTIKTCLICGKQADRGTGRRWYICSRECWLKRKQQLWAKYHPVDITPIKCHWCGKDFVPHRLIRYKAKYCSVECKSKGVYRNRKKFYALHPEYNKRRTPYFRELRKKQKWGGNWWGGLERDGHKCRICGSARKIQVHHLDNEGEKHANNHAMGNLLTVCGQCHKDIHGISLIQLNGEWRLTGRIFSKLRLDSSPPLLGA